MPGGGRPAPHAAGGATLGTRADDRRSARGSSLTLAVARLGASRLAPQDGYDGAAFVRYAQVVKATRRPADARRETLRVRVAARLPVGGRVQLDRRRARLARPGRLLSALLAGGARRSSLAARAGALAGAGLARAGAAALDRGDPDRDPPRDDVPPGDAVRVPRGARALLVLRGRAARLAAARRRAARRRARPRGADPADGGRRRLALAFFAVLAGRRRRAALPRRGRGGLVLVAGPVVGLAGARLRQPARSRTSTATSSRTASRARSTSRRRCGRSSSTPTGRTSQGSSGRSSTPTCGATGSAASTRSGRTRRRRDAVFASTQSVLGLARRRRSRSAACSPSAAPGLARVLRGRGDARDAGFAASCCSPP